MKAVVWGWAVIVTLVFCCAVHGAPDISGVYDTDFKELTLHQDGTRVTGTYKHRNGQIEGTLDGYVLTGRWVQSNGRGRLVFEFNPDLSGFKGKWGNRDATPKARWNGKKTADLSVASVPPVQVPADFDISGVYDTDYKELTLHQDGTRVTGTYKHRNGQIEGTLDGYVLTGRWVQSNGRGRLVFEFNPDLSGFKGKWGNRDATPKARWDGRSKQKKIGDAEKNTGNLGQSLGKTNSERGSILIAEKHGISEIKAESSDPGSRKLDSDTAEKTRKAGSKEISRKTPASDKTEVVGARGKAGVDASSSSMTEPNEPMGQIPEQLFEDLSPSQFDSVEAAMNVFGQLPALPSLSSMMADAKASPVAPRIDPAEFSKLQYLGVVSAVKQAFEILIGPMPPAQRQKFDKQWAAIYDYPADACITYLNAASPLLGEILSLRASLMKVIQGYDNLINQAQTARLFGNHVAAHNIMRRAGHHAALMKALNRRCESAIHKLSELGAFPDAAQIKANVAAQFLSSKRLLRHLAHPLTLSGEYEPAPYVSIQDPYDQGRRREPNPRIIRTEPDNDYERVTYFQALGTLGEKRVLMYLCETDEDENKDSWLMVFECLNDHTYITYTTGAELTKIVIELTEDGFVRTEYAISPKNFIAEDNDFSEQVIAQLRQNRLPAMDLTADVRTRMFHANYVQYQGPPTDETFNWTTWEREFKKYEKEMVQAYEDGRLAFERLSEQVRLPDAVPAEEVYWVLERSEVVNEHPTGDDTVALFVENPQASKRFMKKMNPEDDPMQSPYPMIASRKKTDVSKSGLSHRVEKTVYDKSQKLTAPVSPATGDVQFVPTPDEENRVVSHHQNPVPYDQMNLAYDLEWTPPPPVIAQAGGKFHTQVQVKRRMTLPEEKMLLPEKMPDMVANLRLWLKDAQGRYNLHGGSGASIALLSKNRFPSEEVSEIMRVACDIHGLYDEHALIEFAVTENATLGFSGIRHYYVRRVMSQADAIALAAQMQGALDKLARDDYQNRHEQGAAEKAAQQHAKEKQAAMEESIAFHRSVIAYEKDRVLRYQKELDMLLDKVKKSGRAPSEDERRQIAALRFNMINARSNAISEQDVVAQIRTGEYVRTETPFDSMARIQFRNNIEQNIQKIEAVEMQIELAEKYIEFLPAGERGSAQRSLEKIRNEAPDDEARYRQLTSALQKKWHGHTEAAFAEMDEELAWKNAQVQALENIKSGADTGIMISSMLGGPQAVALTYHFATGWAEKDLLTGVKKALVVYSDAVDIAWSTYDGYSREGWEGAVLAGGISILTNKGVPYLLGKMKTSREGFPEINAGRQADAVRAGITKADNAVPAVNATRKLKVDDARFYEQELKQAEEQVQSFVSTYHKWRRGMKDGLPDQEIRRLHQQLINATASINGNPAAKGFLKYKAPPVTGRLYAKSLDNIHARARTTYYQSMKEAGYSDHEIIAIRNASSAGSTGMDFDQALKEQPDFLPVRNADGTKSMRRNIWLTKHGKPVSRHQWQVDAQTAWNDAYKQASHGQSAPRSWEKMTTRVDPEAYRMTTVLNIHKDLSNVKETMDDLDPKWVRQTSDVTLFKAGEMLNDKSISRFAGIREACRGTAKDLDNKFLPFIETRLTALKHIDPGQLSKSDKHNIQRLEVALHRFTNVKKSFEAIGKAEIPPNSWENEIKLSTGGKGIIETIQDLSDLTQSLFM